MVNMNKELHEHLHANVQIISDKVNCEVEFLCDKIQFLHIHRKARVFKKKKKKVFPLEIMKREL